MTLTEIEASREMPFAPLVRAAVERCFTAPEVLGLVGRGCLEDYAFRALEAPLVYLVNERRLGQENDSSAALTEQYLQFVSQPPEEVLSEMEVRFPRHWRRWMILVGALEGTVKAVTRHWLNDRGAVSSLMGVADGAHVIDEITPVGDAHSQGVVCEVKTSAGRVYYKPRSGGNEKFLTEVVNWLALLPDAEDWLPLETVKVVDRGDHCWVAAVAQEPLNQLSEATDYYVRAGELLAISYLLNITDLHHENVVAGRFGPVVVDLETMMTVLPRSSGELPGATLEVLQRTTSSVASTGLIPLGTKFQELGGDVSGLAATSLRVRRRFLERQGRSDIGYSYETVELPLGKNLPTVGDQPVHPQEHLEELLHGFRSTLRLVMAHRQELIDLITSQAPHVAVRVIARMTNDYSVVLAGLARLSGDHHEERMFALLNKHASGLNDGLLESERRQLASWVIPHFWASGADLSIKDSEGIQVGTLSSTPVSRCIEKLERLSEGDIEQEESAIRLAFVEPASVVLPLAAPNASPAELAPNDWNGFIRGHIAAIRSQAVTTDDDTVNWPTTAVDDKDLLTVQPLVGGVYRGVSGVADLLAADPPTGIEWAGLADKLLNTLRVECEALVGDGQAALTYYHGPGSRLAAARRLAKAYELPAKWVDRLQGQLIDTLSALKEVHSFDVMDGAAGLVIALRHAPRGGQGAAVAVDLARRLAAQATRGDDGWTWDVPNGAHNASFAHDAGGVGTALLVGASISADPELVLGWLESWRSENRFRLARGWADRRRDGTQHSSNWCHGVAGMAVERVVWLDLLRASPLLSASVSRGTVEQIEAELIEAGELLLDADRGDGSASLCHGVAGTAVALNAAARCLDRPEWTSRALEQVHQAGARLALLDRHRGTHDVRDLGIMTGAGGLIVARSMILSSTLELGPLMPDLGMVEV